MLAGLLDNAEWVVLALILANQAGIPVFAAPALLGVGALAWNGDVNVAVALIGAVGAALCADLVWYGLGRWRGTWVLAVFKRLSPRTAVFVNDAQRLFLSHDRAFQLGARFLPELNPVAAAFAGMTSVRPGRFVVSATVSAALWAGTWIGVGYLIGGAIWNGDGSGVPILAVIVAMSAVASLSALIRPAGRALAAISRWFRAAGAGLTTHACPPSSPSETGGRHADAALHPGRDRSVCHRVRVACVDKPAQASQP